MYHKQILLGKSQKTFRNDPVQKIQKTSVDTLTTRKEEQKQKK